MALVAQPLPALAVHSEAVEPLEEVDALMLVNASGCGSFGRRRLHGLVEWSGELPAWFFTSSASKYYYPSLNFQIEKLEEPAQISIVWVCSELPAHVARPMSPVWFDAVWSRIEWEVSR